MHAGRPFQADPLPAALRGEVRARADSKAERRSTTLRRLRPIAPGHARPRNQPRPAAAGLLLLALAVAAGACSATPQPDASRSATVLATLPVPPSASMTVGQQGPGVDGDAMFYAYTSPRDPGNERSAYDAALRSAGFDPVQRSGVWTAYRRDGATVWVSVSTDGPPTSIVALVATDPTAIGLPARLSTDAAASGQLAAVLPPGGQATPDPPTRTGAANANAGGQGAPGGRATSEPGLSPTPASSPDPAASPAPSPSAKPHPNDKPKPSHAVAPTPKPKTKATPTPTPTPKPKPSQAASPGATPS